jgi:membrane-associated phospholipid phosphatase
MDLIQETRDFLRRVSVVVAVAFVIVLICYAFIDRSVAFFVHRHRIAQTPGLVWSTYLPPWVQTWSPLVIALLVLIRALRPWQRWQYALFVACISLIVADQFRTSLGDVCGRYWPETWHDNNPSLFGSGAYGFHPFRAGADTGSFPSGHAARIAAFASVFWIAMPRGRWLYVVVCLPVLIALVGMNYHFVSDVIAGGVLGSIVGGYAVCLSRIQPRDVAVKAR